MASPTSAARRRASKPAGANYDLRASQVETPGRIVKFFWEVVHSHRNRLGNVLDMGAGDGKFASHGNYQRYTGVEIDSTRITNKHPRKSATVVQGCVFAQKRQTYDACIGNPPYLRHQDIESPWKEATIAMLSKELDVALSGHSNLFLYFMALGLIRIGASGLAALVVPFDWVSRPSARGLRAVIEKNGWAVSVYRFTFPVFDSVETTASVSVIDKGATNGLWTFHDVSSDFRVVGRRGVTGTGHSLLNYARRGTLFARRGMSPGSQHVFTLTDGERMHHGLRREDVLPCVTTLRRVSDDLTVLDRHTFEQHFVKGGLRCWLIRSRGKVSDRLRRYLDGIPLAQRSTATCILQEPWYNYEEVSTPDLLVHSGFTTSGPRVVINRLGVIPVGSMYGIYGCPKGREERLMSHITSRRVMSRVVPHSGRLRKIEVGQLNSILASAEGDLGG